MNDEEKIKLDDGVKDTFGDKVNKLLRDWLIDIVIALMIIIYVLKTLVTIAPTGNDIISILGDSALMLVFLVSIKTLMRRKGMFAGEKNNEYVAAKARYEAQLLKILPKSMYLSDYTAAFNAREQREKLTRVLAPYGVSFEQYESGFANPTKTQQLALKAAARAKYLRINVTDLTGSGVTDERRPGLGKTKSEFMRSKNVTDTGITLLSVTIFSAFTFKLATNFDWANFIWVVMQVVVFLIKGTISFMSAYVFVTEEYTNRLIRQTNMLIDFDSMDINEFESKKKADENKRMSAEREEAKRLELARISEERQTLLNETIALKAQIEEMKNSKIIDSINTRVEEEKWQD